MIGRFIVLLALAAPMSALVANAAEAETRTLKLYFIHTGERAEITFKRNGRYDQSGLNKINRFLRDWRKNEPTKMDPQLLDIVWEAYQMAGARDYIHVISGYRSPATNDMLRRTRGGQAKKSQHMLGKALDFYIPGVKLSKLREIGFKLQGGGVGYYPKSGSPFVHLDTGNVRAWPRMSRSQLVSIFPNGGTLHLPPDGKPLPGYQQALAEYKQRKARGQATAIATRGKSGGGGGGGGGTLLAALFNGGASSGDDDTPAPTPRPAPTRKATAEPEAKPRQEPSNEGASQTLLAAVSGGGLFSPRSAPRPAEAVPSAPAANSAPEPVANEPEPKPAPTIELASLPLPQPRPEALIASSVPVEEPAQTGDDAMAETAIAASDLPAAEARNAAIPLPASRPESAEDPLQRLAALPTPARNTLADKEPEKPSIAVAYAPPRRPSINGSTGTFPRVTMRSETSAQATKSARLAPPKQPTVPSYDTGVTTTAKSDRLNKGTVGDAEKRSSIVAAGDIDPSRFGSVATASVRLAELDHAAERPKFIQNALREAPSEVYTAGFRKEQTPDATRFSGNAVTFMAVAKFQSGGTGGDGQPLTLQLPITN